jgi:hypothetical protein
MSTVNGDLRAGEATEWLSAFPMQDHIVAIDVADVDIRRLRLGHHRFIFRGSREGTKQF